MSDRPRGRRAPSVSRGVGGALAPRAHFGRRCCRRGTVSCPAWRRARAARRFRATRHLARLARATSPPPRATTRQPLRAIEVADETSAAISPWSSSRRRSGNTGTIARTCAATRVPLHLVGPLGFSLEDSQLKRAGLDYWCVLRRHTPAPTRPASARPPPASSHPPSPTDNAWIISPLVPHAPSPDAQGARQWDAFYSYWREELGSPDDSSRSASSAPVRTPRRARMSRAIGSCSARRPRVYPTPRTTRAPRRAALKDRLTRRTSGPQPRRLGRHRRVRGAAAG